MQTIMDLGHPQEDLVFQYVFIFSVTKK